MKIKMNSLYIGIALMCMMLPASLKSLPFGIEITVLAMVVCIVAFFLEFERIHMCPTLFLPVSYTHHRAHETPEHRVSSQNL